MKPRQMLRSILGLYGFGPKAPLRPHRSAEEIGRASPARLSVR
ncbi:MULTISPECIES: hypothetical protein [unclassified Brevundimonas]|nr:MULTISPECIES: hypothetical protein [unclassified Brevundimonas]